MAYPSDLTALGSLVEASNNERVKKGSRDKYANTNVRVLQWLSVNYAPVMNKAWLSAVSDEAGAELPEGSVLGDAFKPVMKRLLLEMDKELPPIIFREFRTSMFLQWVQTLETGFDTASGHRSAFRGLFQDYGVELPADWDAQVSLMFKGLKRQKNAVMRRLPDRL